MATCVTPDCGRDVHAKGLCGRCYKAAWAAQNPEKVREYRETTNARARAQRMALRDPFADAVDFWCSITGCGYPRRSGKRYCAAHQSRVNRDGKVRASVPVKRYPNTDSYRLPPSVQAVVDEALATWRSDPHAFADLVEQVVSRKRGECRVRECTNAVAIQGSQLCKSHAEREYKYGDPLENIPFQAGSKPLLSDT